MITSNFKRNGNSRMSLVLEKIIKYYSDIMLKYLKEKKIYERKQKQRN